jgi:hypothetical protein
MSHCTRTPFCKMTNADDNIKWFHLHCSSTYNWLETVVPMVDIATFTIKHINRLCLSHVSKKAKSDFFKILLDYSKANGNLVVFYIEPITLRLLNIIEDDEFNVDNFVTHHLSMPIVVPEHLYPLANLLEQGIPLTNNLSKHAKMDLSRQLQRIHVEHLENIPKQKDVIKTPPETHKAKVPMKHHKFRKLYSIADAWLNGNIAKYQQKLSGRRSADFKFLYPYLECSTCAFPHTQQLIPIGEKSYTNVCANTDVWLDGDFISTFASLCVTIIIHWSQQL